MAVYQPDAALHHSASGHGPVVVVAQVTVDGTPKGGATKAARGTDQVPFGCAMPNWHFGRNR